MGQFDSRGEKITPGTHSCEDEGHHEDQMRCEDYEEVDGGILDDGFHNCWSRYGYRSRV